MAPEDQDDQQTVTDDRELYAVYDKTLTQFVSGVGSKSDADKARKALGGSGITQGHELETRRV
jgi:hypothetical protein